VGRHLARPFRPLAARAHDHLDALSHGNQERVQLIAALVNERDLLVLDEPFSGLDPHAIETMADLLGESQATVPLSPSRATNSIWSSIFVKTLSSSITERLCSRESWMS
jgi:ABC-type taurine transport system ATPase subunit